MYRNRIPLFRRRLSAAMACSELNIDILTRSKVVEVSSASNNTALLMPLIFIVVSCSE